MLRIVRVVLLVLLGLSLLVVAMANRTVVPVRTLPDDLAALTGFGWELQLPLYVVIFAGIVAGLVIGFVWEWLREMRLRNDAGRKTREVARLERELAVMRDASSTPKDDVLALLDGAKAGARAR